MTINVWSDSMQHIELLGEARFVFRFKGGSIYRARWLVCLRSAWQ